MSQKKRIVDSPVAFFIKKARKTLKQNQDEFGKLYGCTKGNVSLWENGLHEPSYAALADMSKRSGVPLPGILLPFTFRFNGDETNTEPARVGSKPVPLVNYVQAGQWKEIVEQPNPEELSEWLMTDLELSSQAFALEIKGDSMLPDFKEGDRVIIDPTVAPNPGDFVVSRNAQFEATFKKYRSRGLNEKGEELIELVPLNLDYPIIRSDMSPVFIIGTMVEHRKYRRK